MNANLVKFIESHDCCNVIEDKGDFLIVECDAIDKDNVLFRLQETITATKSAARDWLGY